MNVPNGFKSQPHSSGFEIPAGAYVCMIYTAGETYSQNGNRMFVVQFDICKGTLAGIFNKSYNRYGGKWPYKGIIRVMVEDKNGAAHPRFEDLIYQIECSNQGYSFAATGYNENTLRSKLIGVNFGEEESMYNGELRVDVRPQQVFDINKINEQSILPRKTLKKNQVAMEPPVTQQPTAAQNGMTEANGFTYTDEPLPF